jgi:hypothetical protein
MRDEKEYIRKKGKCRKRKRQEKEIKVTYKEGKRMNGMT